MYLMMVTTLRQYHIAGFVHMLFIRGVLDTGLLIFPEVFDGTIARAWDF